MEKKLSVLIISPAPAVHGGVSVFAETLKTHLLGCDVTSFFVGSITNRNEKLWRMLLRLITAPFKIAYMARRRNFDAIHINPSLNYKSLFRDGLILLALRIAGYRRILVYFHGWELPVASRIHASFVLRAFFAWLLKGTPHIMVLSPEFKASLEAMGMDGKSIALARTMFDGAAIKGAVNMPDSGGKTILFMSRLVREKGVHELLQAFALIAGAYPDAQLIFAGEGEEYKALQAKAAYHLHDRVTFTGYVSGKEKYALLCSCSIFALPTYFPEGMPVALLEAMGAGKPLLTGSAGSIKHILRDPDNGVVLENITAEIVEKGLRRLLDDADYCRQAGEHNKAYAWSHFEAAIVSAEIEKIYYEIAKT